MKISKTTLLLLARIVWLFAGFNVLRIGIITYSAYLSFINYLLSLLVFSVFQLFIFSKLVLKHTARINAYTEKQFFLKFFDLNSFITMAFMMSLGIWLCGCVIVSDHFFTVF